MSVSTFKDSVSSMDHAKSPLRYLLSGAGIQLIAIFVTAIIGFLLTPFMIDSLGDRDYGLYVLVGSFAGWLSLLDFGLSGAVARYVAISFSRGDSEGCASFASSGFYLYLWMGLVAFGIAALSTLGVPMFVSGAVDIGVIRALILLSAAALAVEMPLRALNGLLSGYMRRDISSGLALLGCVTRAAVTVLILTWGGGLIALNSGTLLVGIGLATIWWLAVKWAVPGVVLSTAMISREKMKSLANFGGISFVGQMAEAVISRLDSFVIAWFVGVAAVPHYVIAATLVSYFASFMTAATGWLMNWFAHRESAGRESVEKSLHLATRSCVILGGFCLFGLVAFGKPFIERWMGRSYLDAYPCLVVLAIGEFLRTIQRPNVNLLLMQARHHLFAYSKAFEAVVNLALSVLLVPRFGVFGVALGTMVASIIVNGILFPTISCAATDISMRKYANAILHGMAVVAILSAVPAYFVLANATPNYFTLIICGILSASFYFPLAFALGTTSSERRQLVAAYQR